METKEYFIKKSKEFHKDRYDYTKVAYKGNKIPVCITCSEHGDFWQKPSVHYKSGCPKCGREVTESAKRPNLIKFIAKATHVHGNTYDYSAASYVASNKHIEIVCDKHGTFLQTPCKHLSGQGCPECGVIKRAENRSSNTQEFISKARKIHGEKYDYSLAVYEKAISKVVLICKEHGQFLQTPNSHLSGKGCTKCANDLIKRLPLGIEEFVRRSTEHHGDKYNYSLVKYTNSKSRVKIICPLHGEFGQNAVDHMLGKGCRSCMKTGYDPKKHGILYILKYENITKVGITNKRVSTRCKEVSTSSGFLFKPMMFIRFEDGSIPDDVETLVLQYLKETHEPMKDKFDGSTECFFNVDYDALVLYTTKIIGQIMSAKTNN